MSDWNRLPLGEVATIERRGISPEEIAVGTKYLGLENIDRGGVINGYQTIGETKVASTKFTFTAEHVLYGKLRPNLGKIARPGVGGVCSTDILPVKPGPTLDRGFLAHYLSQPSMIEYAASRAAGANLPRLSPTELAKFLIPLPPIEEQRRIAAILDQADALRAKRREALTLLDDLTQSIFVDMFHRPRQQWRIVQLGDIADVKGGKRLPKGAEYAQGITSHPYIRVTDMRNGNIDEASLLYLKPEVQQRIARYTVNSDDVIISIAGSIGLLARVPSALDGANLTENAAKIVAKAQGRYVGAWLRDALRSAPAQGQIRSHVGQVTIGKLALFRIEKIRLALPPISLQTEYARRIDSVESIRPAFLEALKSQESLLASLQARAFSARL